MDNQKSNDGNARNVGSEGSGSSMGKDLNKDFNKDSGANRGGDAGRSALEAGKTIDRAVDSAKSSLADATKTTAADAHTTIDKAAQAAQPVVDRLASSAHAGVDKISGALAGVTGNMDERTRQLTDAAKNFAETGRGYVRSSPATSVLVALAAGYTLSKIFGRRH